MPVNEVLDLAITYNGNDVRRINHLLKVFSFASHIGIMENCDSRLQTIIEISALLHDIGIHEKAIDGIDFQILVEADFLVNIFEDEIDKPGCEKIKENIFKTKTGIKLLERLYI